MEQERIRMFVGLLNEVVAMDGTWQEKKNKLLEAMTEDDKNMLYEFVGWFE
jgi:hypothetical protein